MAKLSDKQQLILRNFQDNRYDGTSLQKEGGWVWFTGRTWTTADALTRRGLLEQVPTGYREGRFRLTDVGRQAPTDPHVEVLARLKASRRGRGRRGGRR